MEGPGGPKAKLILPAKMMLNISSSFLMHKRNSCTRSKQFLHLLAQVSLYLFLSYGDRTPASYSARVFCIAWIMTGLCVFGILSGEITAAMTDIAMDTDIMLYGANVSDPCM